MFNNIQIFITPLCPHRPTLSIISHHFQLQRVEASQCYLFENWWIKLKFPNLLKPLGTIMQQNYQFFYPSQPFSFIHFNMMHPVLQSNFYPSNKQTNKQTFSYFYHFNGKQSQLERESFNHVPSWRVVLRADSKRKSIFKPLITK